MNNINFIKFFENLGLTEDEVKVCIAILDEGKATMLKLAQKTNINRTTIYRICEELGREEILQIIEENDRKLVQLAEMNKIKAKVEQKQRSLLELSNIFPELESYISSSDSIEQTGTKILFYRGKENIKQLFWNSLRAENELLSYQFKSPADVVGEEFAFKWHEEFVAKGLKRKAICAEAYQVNDPNNALTNLLKLKFKDYPIYFHNRNISSSKLNISTQIDIYNDYVSYYKWFNDEAYGVEIENIELASMQRQIFGIIWDSIHEPQGQILKSFS